jgi:hypothetical protein
MMNLTREEIRIIRTALDTEAIRLEDLKVHTDKVKKRIKKIENLQDKLKQYYKELEVAE